MPKFHDEFFRGTTSQHDQLVVDTIQSIDQIVKRYTDKLCEGKACVQVFRCTNRKFCGESDALLKEETKCNNCEYVKYGSYGYSLAPPSFQSETESVNAVRTRKIVDTSTIVETEKIYANQVNGFIIGYADIVVQVRVDLLTELATKQSSWCIDEEKVFYIIIDAKPRLQSWGGPLRQVKTYMRLQQIEHDAPVYGIITTYSRINETHLKIIEQEQVSIITVPIQTMQNGSQEGQHTG